MKTPLLSLAATCLLALPATAQTSDITLTEDQKRLIAAILTAPKASPGSAIGVPSGFGASQGQVFASIGGTSDDGDLDGSASVGLGFGDAQDAVAVEVTANIFSLTNDTADSGFGEIGSISAKISRSMSPTTSLSFGAENLIMWGDGTDNIDPSVYLAYSMFTALSDDPFNPRLASFTLGVGNERFANITNNVADEDIGFFASAGLNITRQIGVAVDYNGNYTSAGVSFVPLADQPIVVSLSLNNVTSVDRADGGTRSGDPEFGASVGYSWQY